MLLTTSRRFVASLAIAASSLLVGGSLGYADPKCEDLGTLFTNLIGEHRVPQELVETIRQRGVPAIVKKTSRGEVLAILVNGRSVDKLADLLQTSVGTITQLQPNWNNDHGMLRVGTKLIDVDSPGARGYGERERTGLSWKEVVDNAKRRDARPNDSVRVEVMYPLRPEEVATAEYYQRVRASAIFRVPFTFGGARADLSKPNTITDGGERCYIFCKASAVRSHVGAIARKVNEMTGASVDQVIARPEAQTFLAEARKTIMGWEVAYGTTNGGPTFSNSALANSVDGAPAPISYLKPILPGANEAKLLELGNWLVGYQASADYEALFRNLGVTGDSSFRDMNNQRAGAVLIYDPNPAAIAAFNNGTYQTADKFGTWTMAGQAPLR